jgi:hypothetical protein
VLVSSILEGEGDSDTSDAMRDKPNSSSVLSGDDVPPDSAGVGSSVGVGESDDDMRRHIQSLQRWDRIPMDTFRRTQVSVAFGAGVGTELIDAKDTIPLAWALPGGRRPHRPADGFSYGSAVGGLLKSSPFSSSTLWEGGGAGPAHGSGSVSSSPSREGGRARGRSVRTNRAAVISPVLLPVGDGERTPTMCEKLGLLPSLGGSGSGSNNNNTNNTNNTNNANNHRALAHALSIKSRKEFKREKRAHRGSVGSSNASFHLGRHAHFPNSKSRSSGSIQRAAGGSGSPSLSI